MVRAIMMTSDQIAGLVEIARRDPELWANLRDRETDQFNRDGSAKLPSYAMLIEDFAREQYGPQHIFDLGSLMIRLRYHVRQELGFPV